MSDTIGGGLEVRGALRSCLQRLKIADNIEIETAVDFATNVLKNPLADSTEKMLAAEYLRKVYTEGQQIALKLLEHERVDGGKATDRKEIVIEIKFDDAG
jgi:hypothetical protein